ncbi:hypothetical protein BKA70DRAFT_1529114 [Coprinopsis sp. MPI-PUGE-AT-0042]|nr:hypothetical protein BKA70DRAFT_1529114 [Coprinopsis sp. MPI-PUGE-AT-0042]
MAIGVREKSAATHTNILAIGVRNDLCAATIDSPISKSHRGTMTAQRRPFERLSTEILSLILLQTVSIYKYGECPINLPDQLRSFESSRLVCHRWNDTIEGEPTFWSSCSVEVGQDRREPEGPYGVTMALRSLNQCFGRAGVLPLTLHMSAWTRPSLVDWDGFRMLVSFLNSHADRLTSLHLEHAGEIYMEGSTQRPWWFSLFSPPYLQKPFEVECFRNVKQLTLGAEGGGVELTECDIPASEIGLHKIFPSVTKLNFGIEEMDEVDAFPARFGPLKDLTWLRLSVNDFKEDPQTTASYVNSVLGHLPQLQHLELNLGIELDLYEETAAGDEHPPLLVHPTLTSLVIPDPAQLIPLFSAAVFPALGILVVGKGQLVENYGNGLDRLGCLQRMLGPSPQLHTLQLGKLNITDEELTAILCTIGSSLRSLHIILHCVHRSGAFLYQLLERSKTVPVLPRLDTLMIEAQRDSYVTESGWATDEFPPVDVVAFKTFVEDPRRAGAGLPGVESFAHLCHALLKWQGQEVYPREPPPPSGQIM